MTRTWHPIPTPTAPPPAAVDLSGVGEGQTAVKHNGVLAGEPLPRVTLVELARANPWGLKLVGLGMPSQPMPATGANSTYWGTGFNIATVRQQLDNAKSAGANCVHWYGSPHQVIGGVITRATYIANWRQALDETAKRGLYTYANLAEWGSLILNGSTRNLSLVQPEMVALAQLLDTYPNVVAIDLFNEMNNGKDWTWVAPTMPLIKAVTSKPVSCDYWVGAAPTANANLDALVAAGADFLAIHTYYTSGQGMQGGGAIGVQPSDFDALATAYGLPFIIDEVGAWDNSGLDNTHRATAQMVQRHAALVEQRNDCAGVIYWCIDDHGNHVDPDNFGLGFFATGGTTEYPAATAALRTVPRRSRPTIQSVPLPSAAVALTTAQADIPNVKLPLDLSRFTAATPERGRAHYRVVALVDGVQAGDLLNLIVTDLDSTGRYVADSGSRALKAPAPSGVTTAVGQEGNALSFPVGTALGTTGFGALEFPPLPLVPGADFTMECWFKRARTGVQEALMGRYTNGEFAAPANRRSQAYVWIGAGGAIGMNYQDAGGSPRNIQSAGGAVNDLNWHHAAWSRGQASTSVFGFLDGVSVGAAVSNATGPWQAPSGLPVIPFTIGNLASWEYQFQGLIDEVRISNTVRYTTGFTPTTTPFVNDANTLLLVHGDSIATGYAPQVIGSLIVPAGVTVNTIQTLATAWTPLPLVPINGGLQAMNATASRGNIRSAWYEVRYA